MKKRIGSTLLLAVLVLVSVFGVACDGSGGMEEDSPGTLTGVVRAQGADTPLSDITVALDGLQTTTDQAGRFAFREVPVGLRTLQISTAGYDAYTSRIDVQAGENSYDISLVHKAYYEYRNERGNYGIYLPPGVPTFRGVIFLGNPGTQDTRGFASGKPRATTPPYIEGVNEYVAAERQRSLLLAEKYGLVLMGTDVNTIGQRIIEISVLEEFAVQSGHSELAEAPLLLMGFHYGGCFAYEFALRHPERTIGFLTQGGDCNSQQDAGPARLVPGYVFLGENAASHRVREMTQLFQENRSQGALWALAVEPGAGFVPVSEQELLFNWMDTVLEARLPETVTPGAPVTLNALDETSGWLGNRGSFAIAEYAGYDGDPGQASWLPSMQTAQDWQTFVD